MYALSALTALLCALAPSALAAVSPTSPSANTVVRVGQDLQALWTADSTGQWTDMTVQLMTGDNFQMVPLAILSPRIDGTSETSHTWTAPNVTPNSQIYFLQFTRAGDVSTATWTTRFTIAAADGSTTPPPNSTTTSGTTIRWGIGQLVGANGQVVPATGSNTNFDPNGGNAAPTPAASSAGTGAGAGAGAVTTLSQAPSALASPSAPVTPSPSPSPSPSAPASLSSASSNRSGSASVSPAAAAASSLRPSSAAGKLQVGGWIAAVAGVVGVAFA